MAGRIRSQVQRNPSPLVNSSTSPPLSSTQKTKTMKDILSEIIAHKRIEIEQQKQAVSLSQLQEQAAAMMQEAVGTGASGTTPVRSMKRALANSSSGIIAEFKRRSPSKAGSRKAHRPTSFLLLMKLPELPPSPSSRMKSSSAELCVTSVQHALWSTSRSCVKTSLSTSISFCKHAL